MPQEAALTADEQKLNDVWNEHLRAEFAAHSPDEAVATMVANPRINQLPVMIGGNGKEEVYEFYAKYFLSQIPPDMETVPVSDHRPRESGRRDRSAVYTHDPNGCDTAWHPADREADRASAGGGRAV
jgi:hypothetical protein